MSLLGAGASNQRLRLPGQGTVATNSRANPAVIQISPCTSQGYVWTGTVAASSMIPSGSASSFIPSNPVQSPVNNGEIWQVSLNGSLIGYTVESDPFGPVVAGYGDIVTLTCSNPVFGATYNAVLSGNLAEDVGAQVYQWPQALARSVSVLPKGELVYNVTNSYPTSAGAMFPLGLVTAIPSWCRSIQVYTFSSFAGAGANNVVIQWGFGENFQSISSAGPTFNYTQTLAPGATAVGSYAAPPFTFPCNGAAFNTLSLSLSLLGTGNIPPAGSTYTVWIIASPEEAAAAGSIFSPATTSSTDPTPITMTSFAVHLSTASAAGGTLLAAPAVGTCYELLTARVWTGSATTPASSFSNWMTIPSVSTIFQGVVQGPGATFVNFPSDFYINQSVTYSANPFTSGSIQFELGYRVLTML